MDGPLKNLLVVDLTRVLVGPYCTMVLSDLGARVIKVEAPGTGDDSRKFGPFIEEYSAYFMSLNRGKESIALNLKKPEDKKIFESIVSKADILVENFKPGTLEKWGLGWKELSKKYPKLIYASASGFGQPRFLTIEQDRSNRSWCCSMELVLHVCVSSSCIDIL